MARYTSIVNVNSSNLIQKTVISKDGDLIYFVSGHSVCHADIASVYSSGSAGTPLPTSEYLFLTGYTTIIYISSASKDVNSALWVSSNNGDTYQINVSTRKMNKTTPVIDTNYISKFYSTDHLGIYYFTTTIKPQGSSTFYVDMGTVDEYGAPDYADFNLPTDDLPTMLISDSKSGFIFFSTFKLFWIVNPIYPFGKTLISDLSNNGTRFIGSVDSENKKVYLCSKMLSNATLSLEIYSFNTTGNGTMTLLKFVPILNIGLTVPLANCSISTIDLVQGQLFFSAFDTQSNQFLISMDLHGGNQQILNLNWNLQTQGYVTALAIKRSSGGSQGNRENNLIVGSNIGSPLTVLNYKSICLNDCWTNGDCISATCSCYTGYGTLDCKQRYPIVLSATALPLKRSGQVTITGDYFNEYSTVTIAGYSCTPVQFINNQTIACTFSTDLKDYPATPVNYSGYYNVIVTVGTLSNSCWSFKYLLPEYSNVITQNSDQIIITGSNIMDIQYQSTIKIGNIPINKPNCNGDSIMLTCKLPTDTKNGLFVMIDIYGNTFNSVTVKLVPIITNISPSVISSAPTVITITGIFFDCQGSEITTMSISNGNFKPGLESATIKSSVQLLYTTPNQLVLNQTLSIYSNYFQSPLVPYSYLNPVITSFKQPYENNGLLRIEGSNFANSIDIQYLSIYSNAQLIDSSKVSIITMTVGYIDLKLSNNFKNSNWSIMVNGKQSNSKYFNLRPSITSITGTSGVGSNGLPIQIGGVVLIVGNYLNTNMYFDNGELVGCTYGNAVNGKDGDVYCTIPSGGSGKFLMISESINPYDTVNDIERSDPPFEYQYNSPVISTIKPTGFYGALLSTKITITGSNYITDQSLVSVRISSLQIPCNISKLTVTSIECSFSSSNDQWPSSIPVVVTVDGLATTSATNQFSHFINCPSGIGGISCSGNGDCNSLTGICACFNGYQSKPDCSVFTQTTISSSTSSTTIGITTGSGTGGTTTTPTTQTTGGSTTTQTTNNPSSTNSATTNSATTTSQTTSTLNSTSDSTDSSDDGEEVSTSNNMNFNNSFVLLIIIVSCLL